MRYESEILYDLMKRDGLLNPSQNKLPYESELKEKYVKDVMGGYPKLQDYRSEWLNYALEDDEVGEFPYITLTDVTNATIENVVPYAYKSAILKGQTLVNLLTYLMPNAVYLDTQYRIMFSNVDSFDKITIVNKNSKTIQFSYWITNWVNYEIPAFNNVLIELPKEVNEYNIYALDTFGWDSTNYREAMDNIVLLHGDYVNQDIPYFEGMQSVKLPVLTTINGSAKILTGAYLTKTGELSPHHNSNKAIEDYILIPPMDVIVSNVSWLFICFYDENKNFISDTGGTNINKFELNDTTIPDNAKYFRFHYNSASLPLIRFVNGTDYIKATIGGEPFKTNILTVNEEVELRGIGEVKDELDLLTGELVQNIHETTLNGQNDTSIINNNSLGYINYQGYMSKVVTGKNNEELYLQLVHGEFANSTDYLLKDGFLQFKGYRSTDAESEEGLYRFTGTDHAYLYIKTSRFTDHTLKGVKQFLSENPQTYYVLNKPKSIKTVDLTITNQNGETLSKITPIEGTMHLTTSSDTIAPTFSGEVPVEAIEQNLESFIGE